MYREITQGIQVEVEPSFVPERSSPKNQFFYYAYKIRITNLGDAPSQLLGRHWVITDGNGEVREVKGAGVVGEQPKLSPGQSFEYTSFCPLQTPTGNMRGCYEMEDARGQTFEAKIPVFFLRDLRNLH